MNTSTPPTAGLNVGPAGSSPRSDTMAWRGRLGQVGSAGDNAAMESFFALLQKNVLNRRPPARRQAGDHHLDRTDLPPPTATISPRTIDPRRIRDHHDHNGPPSRLTQPVTQTCSRPPPRQRLPALTISCHQFVSHYRCPGWQRSERVGSLTSQTPLHYVEDLVAIAG